MKYGKKVIMTIIRINQGNEEKKPINWVCSCFLAETGQHSSRTDQPLRSIGRDLG